WIRRPLENRQWSNTCHAVGDGERQTACNGRSNSIYAALYAPSIKGELLSMQSFPHVNARPSAKNKASTGFTLMEVLVSLLILVTVTGAVFEQINSMQKKS